MTTSEQVPEAPTVLAALRGAILQLLPSFAEKLPWSHQLRFGIRAPARYLLLPASFEPLQLVCHPLAPLSGHASCEVLDHLAKIKTPVAAVISVQHRRGRVLPISAVLASPGRRESVWDYYRQEGPAAPFERVLRHINAPVSTPSGSLLHASLDLGLRDLEKKNSGGS